MSLLKLAHKFVVDNHSYRVADYRVEACTILCRHRDGFDA